MFASCDLFEFGKRDLIGNERLASGKIGVKAVSKLQLAQIVMAQMSDG